MNTWKQPLADWSKLDLASAQLIFAQAEEAVKQSSETYNAIDKKAERLMQIILPTVFALMAYTVNRLALDVITIDFKLILAVTICLYLVVAFGFLYKNIFPSFFYGTGAEPKNILVSELFDFDELTPQQKNLYLIINLIEGKQKSITANWAINNKRNNQNKIVIKLLIWLPSTIILALAVLYLLELVL